MPCVSKPSCTSPWLMCYIQCHSVSPIYLFLGQQSMIDVIIPYFNIFFSISMSCCDFHSYLFFRKIQSRVKRKKYIQKSRIVRDPIRKVNHLNLCLMFHILFFFFLMPQDKGQQLHFLLLAYFTFVTTTFRFRRF